MNEYTPRIDTVSIVRVRVGTEPQAEQRFSVRIGFKGEGDRADGEIQLILSADDSEGLMRSIEGRLVRCGAEAVYRLGQALGAIPEVGQ